MSGIGYDLRLASRILLRRPAITLTAVVTLALGIGVNSAIFSIVDAVLLRPLPFPEADRLVMVWETIEEMGMRENDVAPGNFRSWRQQNAVFEDLAAFTCESVNLAGEGAPEKLSACRVSPHLFTLLGVPVEAGRALQFADGQPGAAAVAVLSHGLWQRKFGAAPGLIGRAIRLDDTPVTVAGIMPRGFRFPSAGQELWLPLVWEGGEADNRLNRYLNVLGRLQPGVPLTQARAEMDAIAARLEQEFPSANPGVGAHVIGLREQWTGAVRPALLVLWGAAGFVLLIACANVANLLLARAAARRKEIAIRRALGAGRARLVRQLLLESLLVAGSGGLLGWLLALWTLRVPAAFLPAGMLPGDVATLDPRVLAFILVLALGTGVVFGLAPAWPVTRPLAAEALKLGGRRASAVKNRPQRVLVAAEIAIALLLLTGAALMLTSFQRLSGVNIGFEPENLLTMEVYPRPSRYPDRASRSAFHEQVIERVEALPGVRSAAVATRVPLTDPGLHYLFQLERGEAASPYLDAFPQVASPGYHTTLGIPLRTGRLFDPRQDHAQSSQTIVVNETMARRSWPGRDPLGRRLRMWPYDERAPWFTVIGVVGDVRQAELHAEPKARVYFSHAQLEFFPPRDLVVRTRADPLSLAAAVRNQVWAIDKDQPVSHVRTMEQVLSDSLRRQRLSMALLGVFALLALVLAVIGIYGTIAHMVAQRTYEIGIRKALGAQSGQILGEIASQGLWLIGAGVAAGWLAALALTRLMESLLYGVSATDPVVFAGVALLLAAVALAACLLPGRRASRIDPIIALRQE